MRSPDCAGTLSQEEDEMGSTYKKIEVVGTSEKGFDDAVKNAIATAARTLEGLSWFEVTELRGAISGSNVTEFQATVRIGFKLKE